MLLCLLLVSKGWCITRDTLQRREVCLAGCNLALLYAAVSVQLSMQSVVSMVPMVVMYLAMLADVSLSILANLRILKARLIALTLALALALALTLTLALALTLTVTVTLTLNLTLTLTLTSNGIRKQNGQEKTAETQVATTTYIRQASSVKR